MRSNPRRNLAHLSLLMAMLLALLPAAAWSPQPVLAESRQTDAIDETSADASEEIVYIDGSGFIRVLDTQHEANKQVQWVSPESGWRDFALGDFDNDGDLEIVGIKGSNASDSVAVVYDPVISKGNVIPGQSINNIPWKEMGRIPLAERPETVVAGNFDTGVPGDEILVVRKVRPGESSSTNDTRVIIYKQTKQAVDGASWTEHLAKNFSAGWDRLAAGNVDRAGGDEVVMTANDDGKVEVYQPDQNFRRLFEYGSDCRPAKDATFGNYFGGGALELLMVKKQSCSNSSIQPSFNVFAYSGTIFPEAASFSERFEPEPQFVFAGDINGNGDDEAILLRNVDSSVPGAKRLFVRGSGDDGIIQEFLDGLGLDSDNGYRRGAAGDIDGDGRDEIIIIRNDRIRWYPNAHNSSASVDFSTSTNRRSIAVGDLDKNGSNAGPQFAASISKIDTTVYFGFTQNGNFTLRNGGTAESIPYFITLDNNPSWLQVTPTNGSVPGVGSGAATINYTIDARFLSPNVTYQSAIRVTTTDSRVTNVPFVIPVTVKVELPPFQAMPPGDNAFYFPCQEPLSERAMQFTITGVPGQQMLANQGGVFAMNTLAGAANLAGDTYLGVRTADGTLAVVDAAGNQGELEVLPGEVTAASLAVVGATNVISFPSQVPWVTSVTVPTTTLPTVMTLVISPTLRTKNIDVAGLVLFGPSTDPNVPFVVRNYPIGLTCADAAAWMPIAGKQ
jgi:hypothetical protein